LNDLAPTAVDRPRVWHDDTLPGVAWMHGAATEYRVDPVDEYIIGVVTGTVGYRLRRRTSTRSVRPGALVVLDPEHRHAGTRTAAGPWRARLLVLPAALLWSTLDELPPLLRTTIDDPVIDDPALGRSFLALHRTSQGGAPRLERECALLTLLDDLLPRAQAEHRPVGDPAVAIAVDYLRETFLHSVDLDTLAAIAGSTKFRLLRSFRREVGVTPHQFLTSVRVAHARRLLSVGRPISEVAAASGFADQSHLTRQFRARLGLTPGQYRRAARIA
jgi:AraC-like DNA-binding protein